MIAALLPHIRLMNYTLFHWHIYDFLTISYATQKVLQEQRATSETVFSSVDAIYTTLQAILWPEILVNMA